MSATAKQVEWEDVTSFLQDAASGMVVGQMVHDETFNLLEAMSALELMDPKMDAGCNQQKSITVDEAIAQGKAPTELSNAQILSVMDELAACEASFHEGQSLTQTAFTCLYMHRPSLAPPVLRAYINMILKTCAAVRRIVMDADVFEEEDFIGSRFNVGVIGEDQAPDEVSKQLQQAEEALEAKISLSKGGKKGGKEDEAKAEPVSAEEAAQCQAMLDRLRYRKAVHTMHTQLAKPKLELQGLNGSKKFITRSLQQLQLVQNSIDLAQPPPDRENTDAVPGFVSDLTLEVTNGPPRKVAILGRKEAYASLRTSLEQLQTCLGLVGVTQLEDVLHFVQQLSWQGPNIVVRSHLLLLLHSEENFIGRGALGPMVTTVFHRFSASCVPAATAAAASLNDFKIFLARMSKPYCMIFRLYCENRARQRRRIYKHLLDWAVLQHDANTIDARFYFELQKDPSIDFTAPDAPCKHPFFSWVFDQSTQLLVQHTRLGFELQMYTPREYPVAFWYLEYLLDLRMQNFTMAYRPPPSKASKKGKKGKSKPKVHGPKPTRPQSAELMVLQAEGLLCRGICQMMHAFARIDVHVPPLNPDHREAWFANRFQVVDLVPQPVSLALANFDLNVQQYQGEALSAAKVFQIAQESFGQAKILLGKAMSHENPPMPHELPALKEMQRVAVTNSLGLVSQLKFLKSPADVASKAKILFNFDTNKHFPTLSVERS